MNARKPLSTIASAIFLIVAGLAVVFVDSKSANAEDMTTIYMTNNTGAVAACLQFTVSGTGGNLTVDPNLIYGGPYAPTVSVTHNGNQSTVLLDWGAQVIQNGISIATVIHTTNGPLSFVNGSWCSGITSGGTIIVIGPIGIPPGPGPFAGPGGGMGPIPPPGGGGGTSCKCKLVIKKRCRRHSARTSYSPWFIGPPRFDGRTFCWWRYCCRPTYKKQIRLYWVCYKVSSSGKVGGEKSRKALTGWITVSYPKGYYKWRFQSWKPRGLVFPIPIFLMWGPPKDLSKTFGDLGVGETTSSRDVFDFNSDEGPFLPTTDAAATFQEMSNVMIPEFSLDAKLPEPRSFEDMLQLNSGPYAMGAQSLKYLADELAWELTPKSPPEVVGIQKGLDSAANSIATISDAFAAGAAPSSEVFYDLGNTFQELSHLTEAYCKSTGNLRYMHVADTYKEAAANMQFGGDQAATGLNTVAERDDFMWIVFSGLPNNFRDLGAAYEAHTRIAFSLKDYVWDTGAIPGALVQITDSRGNLVDEIDVPVSDRSFINLPLSEDPDRDEVYFVSLKLPTILSASTVVSSLDDGNTIDLGELSLGDADDDDCVTDLDADSVAMDAEKGAGGQDAEYVPATDIDGNGIVDFKDVEIVFENVGQCGQGR